MRLISSAVVLSMLHTFPFVVLGLKYDLCVYSLRFPDLDLGRSDQTLEVLRSFGLAGKIKCEYAFQVFIVPSISIPIVDTTGRERQPS